MNTYRYNIPDTMGSDEWFEFRSRHYYHPDACFIVEDAAEDYHQKHDGWEASWPITFIVQLMDGTDLGTYDVERESVLAFYSTRMKK